MTDQRKSLGLIAGSGKFPFLFSREARRQNYKVFAVAIKKDTSFFLPAFVDDVFWIGPGELKKLFSYFKKKEINKIVMAGQVNPKNLFDRSVKIDEDFKKLFDAMKDRKADTIFSAVADRLRQEGLDLLDSTFFLKEYLAPKGLISSRSPKENEKKDIEFGKTIAKMMGSIDVGQTVVVKEKAIIAIEAMEGTDSTILRSGKIAQGGTVVVKMSKPEQDLRFDVPVVGPRTLKTMARAKACCLAVESGKTLVIDKTTCRKIADRHGISMVGV